MLSLKNTKPMISVCVPVFNGEKYLKQTLESIAKQSYDNLEIIIIDDNSIDKSSEVIREFCKTDSRAIAIKNPLNIGLHQNCRKCIEITNSKWIKFVFQDDILGEKCIEQLYITAQKTQASLILGKKKYIFSESTSIRNKISYKSIEFTNKIFIRNLEYIAPQRVYNFFLKNMLGNFLGEPSCFLIKKEIIRKYGDFNQNLKQLLDYEFYLRIAANEGLACSHKAYIAFRVHNNSETSRNSSNTLSRPRELDYVFFLYTIITDKSYRELVNYSRKLIPINYIESLLSINAIRVKNSKNPSHHSHWTNLVQEHPTINEYTEKLFLYEFLLYMACKFFINTILILKKH